ncbi:MAG TPA: SseB family protein [Actinocatenispora sp.]
MAEFEPVNELEFRMRAALAAGDQETYLRLLAAADLVMPVGGPAGDAWPTVVSGEVTFVAAYTSPAAMAVSTTGQFERGRSVPFREMVARWPDPAWSLVVDPGLPLAAHLPASLVRQMAGGEFGVRDTSPLPPADAEPDDGYDDDPYPAATTDPGEGYGAEPGDGVGPAVGDGADPAYGIDDRPGEWPPPADEPVSGQVPAEDPETDPVPTVMQKVIPPEQVGFYLDKGYDWVAGYVHRWQDAAELETVPDIVRNLGLTYEGSPFSVTDDAVHVLRWTAYRSELYQVPAAEAGEPEPSDDPERPPYAGEPPRIPEYRIDSIRLPHQAEMWRIAANGSHRFMAVYDADEQRWLVNRDLVRGV